jgi:hypothetical protein
MVSVNNLIRAAGVHVKLELAEIAPFSGNRLR